MKHTPNNEIEYLFPTSADLKRAVNVLLCFKPEGESDVDGTSMAVRNLDKISSTGKGRIKEKEENNASWREFQRNTTSKCTQNFYG